LIKKAGQMTLKMSNVHLIPPNKGDEVSRFTIDSMDLAIPTIAPPKRTQSRKQLNIEQLYAKERRIKAEYTTTQSKPAEAELFYLRREIAERFSIPFACLAVTLAAAPLGARVKRSGRSYTFGIGFFVIAIYYVLDMLAAPTALYSLNAIILRSWIPNLTLISVGLVLLWKVDRI